MSETIYLDEAGVRVTSRRMAVGDREYDTADIRSVGKFPRVPDGVIPGAFAVLGLVVLVLVPTLLIAGVDLADLHCYTYPLIFVPVITVLVWKKHHLIVIGTPDGDVEILVDEDGEFVDRVVAAVSRAIADRRPPDGS